MFEKQCGLQSGALEKIKQEVMKPRSEGQTLLETTNAKRNTQRTCDRFDDIHK